MIEVKEFAEGLNGIPQFPDRKKMWGSLHIEVIPTVPAATRKYVEHLDTIYSNGFAKYGCFWLGESELLDWYCSRGQFKELRFFENIWAQEPVKSYFGIDKIDGQSNTQFTASSPFVLGGSLAWVLDSGGAYGKPSWSGAESKRLGEAAAIELIASDYKNSVVFNSNYGWCNLFYHVAWDYTLVVLNKKERLLHLLIATDTD